MNRDDFVPRLAELFGEAIELDATARAELVREALAGDAVLGTELESLLSAHTAGGGFPERLDAATAFALLGDEMPEWDLHGRELGPWRLIRELGVGGMGVVCLAERNDGAYEQQVALKMLPMGVRSPELRQRFLLERRILARLEHPLIGRLVDGGVTGAGDPWLAMEYVEGERLTAWCDGRQASIEERLALFCSICQAVEYAHGRLVVHRDLKPANILVTDDGALKLLDFGIAKLLAADDEDAGTDITRVGVRPFTPGYAAPEQRDGGEVTVATDVYSLGAVLHELLTGAPPPPDRTDATAPSATLARIAGSDPEARDRAPAARGLRIHQLERRLAGDLDTIVTKALRADPARRYPSAQALREDVQRHRDGHPIQARPETLAYRAAKFVQRHRVGVAAAALVLVSLIGGLGATVWQARVAAAARIQAEQEAERAQLEAEKAQQVSNFLAGLFRDANPARSRAQDATAREILDLGAERVEAELRDQPEVQANLQGLIGQAYSDLGLFEEARRQHERSFATNAEHFGRDHPETAKSLEGLGIVHYRLGDYDRAQEAFEEVLSIREAADPPEPRELASVLNNLGLLQNRTGQHEAAVDSFDRASELYIEVGGPENPDVARALNNKGLALYQLGRYEEAASSYEQALAIHEAAFGPNNMNVAGTLGNLAEAKRRMGRTEGVEEMLRRCLAIAEQVLGPIHNNVATAYDSLGRFLADQQRYDEAIAAHQRAIEVYSQALAPDHPYVAFPLGSLGNIEHARGRPADAIPYFEQALAIREQAFGPEHPDVASSLASIGAARFDAEQLEAAAEPIERALAIRRATLPAEHLSVADSLVLLGRLEIERGDCDAAVIPLEEAAAIRAEILPDGDAGREEVAGLLARCSG
jgi:serine/threonine-protein kinase